MALVVTLVAVAAFSMQRWAGDDKSAEPTDSKRVADRPAAASTQPRRLEVPPPVVRTATPAQAPRIPAIEPTADEAEPIGVRRTGTGGADGPGSKRSDPADAPILIVARRPGTASGTSTAGSDRKAAHVADAAEVDAADGVDADDPIANTRRNLQAYQRQLQDLLDSLTKRSTAAAGTGEPSPESGSLLGGTSLGGSGGAAVTSRDAPAPAGSLFGGQLQGSATPRTAATTLGHRSLTLPKGTAFTCALKTKVISATSGLVGCQVQRNVFSDDGRVLLIERGSHLDGEYRIASVRPGTVRIPVLWTRIRTPLGVTVDIDSPGTGQLGASGIDGYVDNRWGERIGAAMLLSLIDESVKLVIQNQANDRQADTIVLPSTTANTSKLAEKVLDSTINIPPLIYQNQGGIVGIYVARDVDFSSVYELRPTASVPPREGTP